VRCTSRGPDLPLEVLRLQNRRPAAVKFVGIEAGRAKHHGVVFVPKLLADAEIHKASFESALQMVHVLKQKRQREDAECWDGSAWIRSGEICYVYIAAAHGLQLIVSAEKLARVEHLELYSAVALLLDGLYKVFYWLPDIFVRRW